MKSALTHLIKISVASIEGCFSNLPELKNTMTSEVTSNFLFQMTFLQKHNVAKEKLMINYHRDIQFLPEIGAIHKQRRQFRGGSN